MGVSSHGVLVVAVLLGVGTKLFDRYLQSRPGQWTDADMGDLSDKIYVVTGATSGIGQAAAQRLVEHNATVIYGVRNTKKAAELIANISGADTSRAFALQLNLDDVSQIRSFAEEVKGRVSHIDGLLNNAGIMMPPFGLTKDGFEQQFGVNHLGHFALTTELFPLLQRAASARVVTVSSSVHYVGTTGLFEAAAMKDSQVAATYEGIEAYVRSKFANVIFTNALQAKLAASGAKVIAVAADPGWTATNLQHTPKARLYQRVFALLNPLFAQDIYGGAWPLLQGLLDPELTGGEYTAPGGLMGMGGPGRVTSCNPAAHDSDLQAHVWTLSEQMVGAPFAV